MKYLHEMSLSDIFGKKVKSLNDVQTVGDLKKLIKYAQSAKRAEAGKEAAEEWAKASLWDETFGKIPGLSTAKNATDMLKAMYDQPDEARTGTALDHLDVDDDVAKIVDDPIENAFLKQYTQDLEDEDDDLPLSDVNVTKELSKFIKNKFNDRTVIGYNESKYSLTGTLLQEALGPNPWDGKLKKQWDGRFPGGSFDVTVEDLQYWADALGVSDKHPLNPSNGLDFKDNDGEVIVMLDKWNHGLSDLMDGSPPYPRIKLRGEVSDWGGQRGSRGARQGSWGARIYVDGPYGSSADDLEDPINLQNPKNKESFADLFKNWLRYANGNTKGALELSGTWD